MSRILIVEDNEKNMKLLRDVLGFKKHEVLEAVDGETGVSMATEHMPDLVLMDIQLPGINGVEALRRLRANQATAKIPVIAVTASVMDQDRRQIIEAGFDAFVSKPHVHGVRVGRRMNRDGGDAELLASALDAQRNLTSVGNQDFVEHSLFGQ